MQNVRAEWRRFKSRGRTVDARVIHPQHEVGDLVLFCPGFPGGGATMFEQRHSERIAGEDFTQIILRHNGTIMGGEHSRSMLNAHQFPDAQPHHPEFCIGGKPANIVEWLLEPQTILEDVGCNYSNIYIYAHSFGAVATLNSLCNLSHAHHPVMERIQVCVCMAPALGTLEGDESENIMRLWQDGGVVETAKDKILFQEQNDIQGTLRGIYETLPQRVKAMSGKFHLKFLHVIKDEYIREKDVMDFCVASGHEDDFMRDDMDRAIPTHGGIDAHDMPVYPTELLLGLIEPPASLIDMTGISKN